MAEASNQGSSDRQANWIGLRTLRQRPTAVRRTDTGETVYEVRSVPLVLPAGSTHFRRLVACARCGRDVPGSSVLSPADLDRVPNPMFCDRCVRASELSRPAPAAEKAPAPAPRETDQPVAGGDPPPEPESEHARRLKTVESQLAELVRGQNANLARVSVLAAEVRAEMRELGERNRALAQAQEELNRQVAELAARVEAHPGAELEATLARELADVRAGLAAMVDEAAAPGQAALSEGLERLAAEVASLQQRVGQSAARSELDHLAGANRALIEAQAALDQRMGELAAAVEERPGAQAQELRAEMASLEGRARDELAGVAALLEAQRKELTEALHDVAHETLASIAEPLRDLTMAREELERQLGALQRKVQEDQRRVEALTASSTAGASRLHALEQRLQTTVQRFQRKPPAEDRAGGALMDSLERQLRDAEERLGQL